MANNEYNPDAVAEANVDGTPEPSVGDTAGDLIHAGVNTGRNVAQGVNNLRKPNSTGDGSDGNGDMPGKKPNNIPNRQGEKKPDSNNGLDNNQNEKDKPSTGKNTGPNGNNPATGVSKPNNENDSSAASKMPGAKNGAKNGDEKSNNANSSNDKGKSSKSGNKDGAGKLNKKGSMLNRFMPGMKSLNPLRRRRNNQSGTSADSDSGSNGSNAVEEAASAAGGFLNRLIGFVPPQYRVFVYASIPIVVALLLILILLAVLLGGTVASMSADSCNESSYGTSVGNDANTDTFMCSMKYPLKNITVTSLYGWRNYDLSHMHNGVDLNASCGTSVYAVHDGTVVFTGVSDGYGNAVQIEHANGITTWYAHLSKIEVSTGQSVKQGSEIAKSGNTGGNYPCHLHFEVRKTKKLESAVSPNAYFGYSDKGYEGCFDRNKTTRNCGFDESGSARKIKDNERKQVCNISSSYFNDGDNSECCETTDEKTSSSLISFLSKFEGSTKSCTTEAGNKGYIAENQGDGAVTAGHGVTNAPVGSSDSQQIILSSSDKSAFVMSGGKYIMKVGSCYNKDIIDKIYLSSIENSYGSAASKSAKKYNVNFSTYEKDAITSLNYNLGSGYSDKFVKAFKDGGYEGLWNAMKDLVHSQGRTYDGLKKRRKAEFALFVTGDYTDKGLFYSRNLNNYDDYDSEGVMARKASGSSSSCDSSSSLATGDRKAVVEVANREYEKWKSGGDSHCSMISKYLKSCGQGGCSLPWCAAFTSYVLNESGVAKKIGLPKSCIANVANSAKNVKVHVAGGSYIPKAGDIITFDWSGSRRTHNHVGIVEKVEGKTVHTIEGNSSHQINKRTYDINSKFIYDYITY